MKTLIAHLITSLISIGITHAQIKSEIPFKTFGTARNLDKSLIGVSVTIDTNQTASAKGIQFSLILRNNLGKAIAVKNIVDLLDVSVYNEEGLDVAVENESTLIKEYKARKWKFRSETVNPERSYINKKMEKGDIKQAEYIELPAGGSYTVNIKLNNIKDVKTPEDVNNRLIRPTIKITPGKYRLKMLLTIFLKPEYNNGMLGSANFASPMIPVNYKK
jgi:hypothetical protein